MEENFKLRFLKDFCRILIVGGKRSFVGNDGLRKLSKCFYIFLLWFLGDILCGIF